MSHKINIFKGFFLTPDYGKLENTNNFTLKDIHDIFDMIDSQITYDKNQPGKFERNAKQILNSAKYNGCSDYATVFEYFARQKGIPTVHLLTAQNKWIREFKLKGHTTDHFGHHFCECYISGKWILVDPLNHLTVENYDNKSSIISAGNGTAYTVYAKCFDIFEIEPYLPLGKSGTQKHNRLMDELFGEKPTYHE